ncbi:hypothetical protein AB0I39_21605 [Kitasatospora purpeofusca]|uniref:hypothetical protein n=1 Tax=Kitasatospora purpeofusca TaxID=67352 RepID=UPI003400910B
MQSEAEARATSWRRPERLWAQVAFALTGYLLTYAAAWILIGLTGHRREDLGPDFWPGKTLSYWESFLAYLDDGVRVFFLIGIPSMLLIPLFVIWGYRSGVERRGALVTVLLLPTWFLFFAGTLGMLLFSLAAQVVHGLVVMPAPPARPGPTTAPGPAAQGPTPRPGAAPHG